MGDSLRCNRCSLDAIEKRAQADGMIVTMLMEPMVKSPDPDTWYARKCSGFPRGEVALVHPPEVSPEEAKRRYEESRARGDDGEFFAAWFGEVTRHCEC